jgi:spore maturation protein CgeB
VKVAYVGQYEQGSTSRMRGEYLRKILSADVYHVADISIPIQKTNRFFRSAGWRFYKGPLVGNINKFCRETITGQSRYDLVWVDKGVFIEPSLLKQWKNSAAQVIHYTPDTAFTYNRSPLFFKGLHYYDFCVTTKSFEIESYKTHGAKEVIFCTQGFDPAIHQPGVANAEKKGIAFVGLNEPYREQVISSLADAGYPVKIAGAGWEAFANKNRHKKNIGYAGKFLSGSHYAAFYSGSLLGLGLLSKKFPELHTTRHFEIPACGTALLTEKNAELSQFFNDDEVIFYSGIKDLVEKAGAALADHRYLSGVAAKGYKKVTGGGYDYENILRTILKKTGILQ